MKNRFFLFIAVLAICIGLLQCTDNSITPTENTNPLGKTTVFTPDKLSEYCEKLAYSLALELDNIEIKNFLKEAAILKQDGDFDIILQHWGNKKATTQSNLFNILNKHNSKWRCEDLIKNFPKLQISIPINCKDWNTSEYTPLVAFYDLTKDDSQLEYFSAFDHSGVKYNFSIKEEYKHPLIVIDLNERTDDEGFILSQFADSNTPTALHSSLSKPMSGIYRIVVTQVHLHDDHEPDIKGAAEIYSKCRLNTNCTQNYSSFPSVDYAHITYSGLWTVWWEIDCDDAQTYWGNNVDFQMWEDDSWPDNDDLVDKYFRTAAGNDMTMSMLSFSQKYYGHYRVDTHAEITANYIYN